MPMTLITGLPGHGKSIHAVRLMYEASQVKEKDRKKIYACNFTDLDYEGLGAEPFEAHEWMKLDPGPNGALLFFDEAWEFFESRSSHKLPPESVKEMARHRHYGFDMYLITQGPFQLDNHVRALVDIHLHVVRPFGMKFYNVRTFQGLERFPDDKQARKRSADTTKRYKFDKKYFGFYKSAEVHTIKRKIPVKLIGALVVVAIAIGAVINLVRWGSGFMDDTRNDNPIVKGIDGVGGAAIGSALPDSDRKPRSADEFRDEYYLMNVPTIPGAPWTAPKYAEILKPVTFPTPYCALIVDNDFCFCISQQGTRMNVSDLICRDLVINGFFDPTKQPVETTFGYSPLPAAAAPAIFSEQTTKLLSPEREDTTGPQQRKKKRPPFTNWREKPRTLRGQR